MVRAGSRPRGFTLIEISIVLLLVGLLALMAGPFTISWMHAADVQRAKGQLVQVHGMARAAALRNPAAITGDDPVVAIRLDEDGNTLTLVSCPGGVGCSEETLWSAALPAGVSLTFDAGAKTSIELNNIGKPIPDTWVGYLIKKGDLKDEGGLY